MLTITNDSGKSFNVKITCKGEKYGLKDCLTHDKDDPLVEFFDATYENDFRFDDIGQFVSRYYLSTILQHTEDTGLILDAGIPQWRVNAENMKKVLTYCKNFKSN